MLPQQYAFESARFDIGEPTACKDDLDTAMKILAEKFKIYLNSFSLIQTIVPEKLDLENSMIELSILPEKYYNNHYREIFVIRQNFLLKAVNLIKECYGSKIIELSFDLFIQTWIHYLEINPKFNSLSLEKIYDLFVLFDLRIIPLNSIQLLYKKITQNLIDYQKITPKLFLDKYYKNLIQRDLSFDIKEKTKTLLDLAENLSELENEIKKTKEFILNLDYNWDGEESKGYTVTTYEKAVTVLKTLIIKASQFYNKPISLPRILPGPDGSIDLHWKTEQYELLVNVPEDNLKSVSFSGEFSNKSPLVGKLDSNAMYLVLVTWVTQVSGQ